MRAIDSRWRREHPLPAIGTGGDKDERGRAILIGGSMLVPGALRLTFEALLRAGGGKAKIATVEPAALPLGIAIPEAGVIALPADNGEIAAGAAKLLTKDLQSADVVILGCGMMDCAHTPGLVAEILRGLGSETIVLCDAAALIALKDCDVPEVLAGRLVLTPHHGEFAALMGVDEQEVSDNPTAAALSAARRFGAVVALKGVETIVAAPTGELLRYSCDAPGLGTPGSGDVLAGIIGGLLGRGVDPFIATGWGVWLHGESGQMAAMAVAPLGFLARELSEHVPSLISAQCQR